MSVPFNHRYLPNPPNCFCYHMTAGAYPSCCWTKVWFTLDRCRATQSHTLTHIPTKGQFRKSTHARGEHANTTQKGSSQLLSLGPLTVVSSTTPQCSRWHYFGATLILLNWHSIKLEAIVCFKLQPPLHKWQFVLLGVFYWALQVDDFHVSLFKTKH